jgi:DNA-binding IscR family transcriptional regulator
VRRDSRLSGVLHVLLHLADRDGPATSEVLARAMGTNPVVVRRVMAGLRRRRLARSEKGHGGGWRLARDPASITLYEVYLALGRPALLAVGHRTESPGCLVEQSVNEALGQAFDDAEALLLARFSEVTLASLRDRMRHRPGWRRRVQAVEKAHAE